MRLTQWLEAALPAHLQLPRSVGRRDSQRCRGDWRRRGGARVFFAEADFALGCGEVLLLRLELLRSQHTASRSQHAQEPNRFGCLELIMERVSAARSRLWGWALWGLGGWSGLGRTLCGMGLWPAGQGCAGGDISDSSPNPLPPPSTSTLGGAWLRRTRLPRTEACNERSRCEH